MKETFIAVAVHLAIIAIIPIQPLWVRATGTIVYLETEKMDPADCFAVITRFSATRSRRKSCPP
jgi:uncharacterized membrane-anchored protein